MQGAESLRHSLVPRAAAVTSRPCDDSATQRRLTETTDKTLVRSKMADGPRDARSDPKQMNNLTFTAPDNGDDDTKKCSGDTIGGDRVKLSFYVELEASGSCEKSDDSGVVADAAARKSTGLEANDSEERKKRCFDRYDSSESSDR